MNSFKRNIYSSVEDLITPPPPTFRAWHFSNPGRPSSGLACANTTFTNVWYTTYQTGSAPALGSVIYSDSSLTSAISGGDLWFNLQEAFIDDPTAYQIGNSGTLDNFAVCGGGSGVLVAGAKRGNSSCSGGLCTLNSSVVDITIYTTDGNLAVGQTVYSDAAMTTPYLTANFIAITSLAVYTVFSVDGSGVLSFICDSDGGC